MPLVDFFVWSQGPNYAFAKQLQRWRAIVQRADGHTVSSTIGPATLTESVMHMPLIEAGMRGCAHFGIEPFQVRRVVLGQCYGSTRAVLG